MSTELETQVRDLMHSIDVTPPPVNAHEVVARGHRVRRLRRARFVAVGVVAVASLGAGVATATIPATGHPLSPLVWAAGPTPSGPAASMSMSVYGQRFQAAIEETRVDHRRSWVMSGLLDDGTAKPIGSTSIDVSENPSTGFGSSEYPTVMWSLFPAGSTDIEAVFKGSAPHQLSMMKISSPFDGPDYVAATVGVQNVDDLGQMRGFTWADASGKTRTYLPYDQSPLTPVGDPPAGS